jgi:4-aminobutyrate aminotransferase/(S)-3-amino-2-methylpropionate transaminase
MTSGKKIGEKRSLPGKRSAELLKLRNTYIPQAVFQVIPMFIARGKGAVIEDVDGNEFIDFAGGIGVLNAGQCNDMVVAAVKEQVDRHLHANHNVTMYESYMRLAEKLAKITPGDFPKQVFFCSSGAEGIENAVKVARRFTSRYGLIAFEGSFHGRTAMTMGLTSQVRNYKYGFGPFDPGIHRFPFAYPYRAPFGLSAEEYGDYCVGRIRESFKSYIASDEIAAVIIEPILGEGGYVVPPANFVQGLRKLCDEHGIVLISDEIQVGMGRTGRMWAIENFGVVPDILVASKSLGGGVPIAAVVMRKELSDSIPLSGLGGTFNGNPLACVAGLKVLEFFEKEKILQNAEELGKIAMARLSEMKNKYSCIGEVRGIGCAIGVELVKDRTTREPDAETTSAVVKACHERGLIIMSCAAYHNVIRFMFPLVIMEEELNQGLDILDTAFSSVR